MCIRDRDATAHVLESIGEGGSLAEPDDASDEELRALLACEPPAYVAVLGYIAPCVRVDRAVAELRSAIRAATNATTTFGYGPRYLHSTGQFHKGGPASGRFIELVDEPQGDLAVPGEPYSFAQLIRAQADGDLQTLRAHDLEAVRAGKENL